MEPIKIWRARLNDYAVKRIRCASLISYYNNTLLKNQILPMHAQECVNQKHAQVIIMLIYETKEPAGQRDWLSQPFTSRGSVDLDYFFFRARF